MAQRARHQSRRGVLLVAGRRQAHARREANTARSSISPRCSAFGASKGVAAYAVAKAGVVQITKALALELAFKGVRVNAIAPGWFVTEINDEFLASEKGQEIKRAIPMGRFGQTGDLDGALLLLASKAGAFITGATMVVDGGQVVQLR